MTTKPLRFAAFTIVLTAASLLQAAIPAAENLLPSDTLAFFTVPDFAAARAAAKSSPGWMFWDDPSMRPFHDRLVAKWNDQFVAPLERDLGVKVADFTDLPQGQLTLAVTANGSNGHDDIPPGLLLLLDAKGQSDSLKTNLALLVKKWTDAGRALRTEQIHGLTFTVVPLSSNDFAGMFPKKTPAAEPGKPPAKPGEIYLTQFDTLLVAANSPKVVEPVAAHLTGGNAPAIADNAGVRRRQIVAVSRASAVLRLVQWQRLFRPDRPGDGRQWRGRYAVVQSGHREGLRRPRPDRA